MADIDEMTVGHAWLPWFRARAWMSSRLIVTTSHGRAQSRSAVTICLPLVQDAVVTASEDFLARSTRVALSEVEGQKVLTVPLPRRHREAKTA